MRPLNAASSRFCQQCGNRLLGPVGAKGTANEPNATQPQPVPQEPQRTTQVGPNWSQTVLGGLAGFFLGSIFGGGRGFFGGFGDRDSDGGDFGGGGDLGGGGGDFGGGDSDG